MSSNRSVKKAVVNESKPNESEMLVVSVKKSSHGVTNVESNPGMKISNDSELKGSSGSRLPGIFQSRTDTGKVVS